VTGLSIAKCAILAALVTACSFPMGLGFGVSDARLDVHEEAPSIAEVNWLAPEADIVQFLTQTPGE